MTHTQQAREWLSSLDGAALFADFQDCTQEDYEQHIEACSFVCVRDAIDEHYDGGWVAFVKACKANEASCDVS